MVSVIIPVYNAGKNLICTVKSVLMQDAERELIIIDDASTDGCIATMVEYLKTVKEFDICDVCSSENMDGMSQRLLYSFYVRGYDGEYGVVKVRIYENHRNYGVAHTRNTGVMLSEGEYVAFLDADDLWEAGKLKAQLQVMNKTNAALCSTARLIITSDGERTGRIMHTPTRITLKMLEKTNYINCSSVLLKRETALKYPMEHDGDCHEDYLTWLKMLKDYEYVVGIDYPYVLYRLSPEGRSRNKLKAAGMTYKTYCRAGYGRIRSFFMLSVWAYNGVKRRV